jgi:hypothetical protein
MDVINNQIMGIITMVVIDQKTMPGVDLAMAWPSSESFA